MGKLLSIICLFLFFSDNLFSQNIGHIYLEEYGYTLIVDKKCKGIFLVTLSENRTIKINLFNCRGKMNVKCYGNTGKLLEVGSYIGSLDLLKKYVENITFSQRHPGHRKISIGIYKYYQPLRDGRWHFYNDDKLFMIKNYEKGILIDSALIK